MNDKQEIKTLLEKRQPFTVAEEKLNIWQKLRLQKREYTIELKPFPLGVVYQITDCLMDIEDIPEKGAPFNVVAKYISQNKEAVTKTIAYALNCSEKEPPERLVKFIKRNLPSNYLQHIFLYILVQTDLANFTSATRLATQRLVADSKAEQKSSE